MEKQDEIGGDTAKATHTPGPWAIHFVQNAHTYAVHDKTATMRHVADVSTPFGLDGDAIGLANARLIASAPDLLAVLHHLNAPERRRFLTLETQVMISDAIAKASEQQ